ncbi:hypothetical protein HNP65_001164 [Thermosipho japonicus]|uniref:Uncharacterized protein n=1 Tax=Thermosipho japonicus TaxID=90323 RepID=A0A841GGJ9_9BACT|nr:hypothetical protein [Thermosipho japonicus]MBB6062712.1 hypothetical protein [Thermosipho japonicus]
MKKIFIVFSILITCIYFASVSPSYSFKFTFVADFTNDFPTFLPSYNTYTEFWTNLSGLGSDFSATFSLKDDRLDSAEVNFYKDNFGINVYKNRVFGETDDLLGLYKFDMGSDGFVASYSNFYFYSFNSLKLNYFKYASNNFKLLYSLRDNVKDYMLEFTLQKGLNYLFEAVYTDYSDYSFEKSILQVGLSEKDWKWGVKITFSGSNVLLADYTNISLENRYVVNIWYNMQKGTIWTNLKSDKNGDNFLKYSNAGLSYDFSAFSISFSKDGFDEFGLTPDKWGDFNVSVNVPFNLFDINGKLSYSFGKPAHNTVGTLGEVYYLELSKRIGMFNLFGKIQRINGVYEKRATAYFELKSNAFSNGELKIMVGNGDFYNVNTFKKIVSVEFNTWW